MSFKMKPLYFDLKAWHSDTKRTVNHWAEQGEPKMAFQAWLLAMQELVLAHRYQRLRRFNERWNRKRDAFNSMADLKNDLSRL